jgi:2'-5' RNA ligase
MRLFVAIAIPDEVAISLQLLQAGVPGARWSTRDQLHLTVRFIGEVDGREMAAIDDGLSTISAPDFSIVLKDVGQFGGRNPSALWAGVAPCQPLMHLERKVESALQRVGIGPETRKFTPHVTLARLKGAPRGRVIDYLSDHALYASTPFRVRAFILYSSQLTPNGSIYRAEKAYQLKAHVDD